MNNVHNLREPVTIDLKPETAGRIAAARAAGRRDVVPMVRIVADVMSMMSEDDLAAYLLHGARILAAAREQNLADRKDTVVSFISPERNSIA